MHYTQPLKFVVAFEFFYHLQHGQIRRDGLQGGEIEDHEEVIVLTDYTHPNSIPIIDSLIKFIQQRYSLQTIIINEITDIDPLQEFDFESQEGYRNYMNDLGRYYDIMKSTDPRYLEVENRVE